MREILEVTQEDIDKANLQRKQKALHPLWSFETHCPIARALRRSKQVSAVYVDCREIYIGWSDEEKEYIFNAQPSKHMLAFITAWDTDQEVKPTRFQIDWK